MPLLFKSAAPSSAAATLVPGPQPATAASLPYYRPVLLAVLALGTLVRLYHFAYDRSFFIDEIYLNVNFATRSFWELATQPLLYEQKAPLGYLWTVKLFTVLFGPGQQALRLFSLLSGVAALFVLVPVARFFLRPWGVVAAVAMLAASDSCIYHALEAKQYAVELLATLLALWLYVHYREDRSLRGQLQWGLLGGLLLWFAFPLIFVLAGLGTVLGVAALLRRDWAQVRAYVLPFSCWLLSFGLQYALYISKFPQSAWLMDFFDQQYDAFMPWAPKALLPWLAHKTYMLTQHPLGLMPHNENSEFLLTSPWRYVVKLGWLHLGFLLAGAALLLRAKPVKFALLTAPIVLMLVVSGLGVYPVFERFTQFIAPLLMLLAAYGLERFLYAFTPRYRAAPLVLLLFLAPPIYNTTAQALNPDRFKNREFNREVIMYVNEHYRPGDAVYLFWNMRHVYEYYQAAYGLRFTPVKGHNVKNEARDAAEFMAKLQPDFAQLQGARRVWFVYDFVNRDPIGDYANQPAWYHVDSFKPTQPVEAYFAQRGRRIDFFQLGPHTASLYEMPAAETPAP
ncbi:glycosyltransferase family 39 protein [Hymenobacter sp. 15J16-1T3B]|uniref:glycosyltransferase family 39 protein n=1 Tax=Hymenobacter sp. 15J16-1T3B TaxID=2886941 RepID=UPI001D0FB538|nr:glycosyltransferase family 39 protein [Hymenobacter sp. 15J16-1T3B]MCC3156959.1 glycosyltransferase family 39 protein [Hymenobacter sp. 15J16-1T3B]